MTKRSTIEIPAPVIEGFLEVAIGAMQSGIELNDPVREVLDVIEGHEFRLSKRLERRAAKAQVIPEDRLEIAYRNLGQIAAINKLLAREDKSFRVGFGS